MMEVGGRLVETGSFKGAEEFLGAVGSQIAAEGQAEAEQTGVAHGCVLQSLWTQS
jgi:hypothetical protein